MNALWRIIVEADSPEDALDRAEMVIDGYNDMELYDYYQICDKSYYSSDEDSRNPVCATDPLFFTRLQDAMDIYMKKLDKEKSDVKKMLDSEFPNGFTSQQLIDLIGKVTPDKYNEIKSTMIRLLNLSNNCYTHNSGIMWDCEYGYDPYPSEELIQKIKDNPDDWYIVEAMFDF